MRPYRVLVSRLVVEVDGAYHAERVRADAKRDAVMARTGYRVLRVEAEIVLLEVETALLALSARSSLEHVNARTATAARRAPRGELQATSHARQQGTLKTHSC